MHQLIYHIMQHISDVQVSPYPSLSYAVIHHHHISAYWSDPSSVWRLALIRYSVGHWLDRCWLVFIYLFFSFSLSLSSRFALLFMRVM